jgi:glucosamine-6-phosphate deaminase
MRVVTLDTEREVARAAALLVAAAAAARPQLVLGLPTGRTALAFYDALAELHRASELDLARARSFNLDELLLPASDPRSFRSYMEAHAWGRIGLDRDRCAIPDASAPDLALECSRYDAAVAAAGGFDLAVLGVGADGHIAYNLPGPRHEEAHVVDLPEAVADSLDVPAARRPLRALTLGFGPLRRARRLLLLATSPDKAAAVRALIDGPDDPHWPCTALREHPQLDVVLSAAAAGQPS